ncbi:TetR/AcrR family transcriptional regulator [Kribbella solani]|uniref:TetR/AcrR family transcriptional repressor of nem operon n=1 Tax=Kribbella solani TaxID=236067 RepID=A0A841DKN0_9ACTN|nr:TetR/AcrR family transcriptional regulator [Kribbella solani]MBB5977615.1 TetR/AcrR family transcriptional repressor of nem operon [Kribbella solani]
MARPRQFDEQDVVARATDLFWRRGYNATSVRDLGSELELTSSSLYRTFTDKHSLFLRALDHYRETESAEAAERLGADGPVAEVLRDWLVWTVSHVDGRGCLVVNSATELGNSDARASERIGAAFGTTRAALTALLDRGRRTGELPADLDVDQVADLVFTLVLGLRVRERAGQSAAELASAVDGTVALVTGPSA